MACLQYAWKRNFRGRDLRVQEESILAKLAVVGEGVGLRRGAIHVCATPVLSQAFPAC